MLKEKKKRFLKRLPAVNVFCSSAAPRRGLTAVVFLGTGWFLAELIVCCAGAVCASIEVRALLQIPAWCLHPSEAVADFTTGAMLGPVSRFSSQFLTPFWNPELMDLISIALNVFLLMIIYIIWRKLSPKPENAEWQGIWRGLGNVLEAWGAPGSSRQEREEAAAAAAGEEGEEDPGEGPSPKPPAPRRAREETKRHGEESEEEGGTATTARQPLDRTEIQGWRNEFARRPNEAVVSWLVRCWDRGASSLILDGNEARQLGSIARDSAVDRGIGRCLPGATNLWERVLLAVKERYPFKDDLEPEMRKWHTAEKGIQYLREMAVVEMLYDPRFVPNNPCQDHDPERLRCSPDLWRKLTRTAAETYAGALAATFERYEGRQRRPPVFELMLTLQNLEEILPPSHASISAVTEVKEELEKMKKNQAALLGDLSLLMDCDEPVSAASEAPDGDQEDLRRLLKELIRLIKGEISPSPASSKVSALQGRRLPARANNDGGRSMARAALWSYLREHGEDMKEWFKKPTPVLRARVRELQRRSSSEAIAPGTAGNP
ncbi:uncharacterized protein LOC110391946 [Numida meleagris]|uniref:uncharacterized protein LOC110391946 n=1 Tax=Numida meleagris TaxID=8996 RepID=UPI000B3DABDC|nr:uncharacterized protein LOC110391946 [Numida meleagris]